MHPLIKVVEPPRARPVTKLLAVIALGVAALPGVAVPGAAVEHAAPVAVAPAVAASAPAPAPVPVPAIEPARPRVMRSGAPACGNVTSRGVRQSASRGYLSRDGDPTCPR